jgi:peptidoglycan/xylan/chitin deacetylase (PgdA/CDA1 family)
MILGVITETDIHRSPRHPNGWVVALVVLHALVAWVWWRFGWAVGLAALVAVHLLFVWGTLRPRSRLFGPVLARLPTSERVAWLTIDDGPSDDTVAMLDLLDAHGARATFFLVAGRAVLRPDLVREIVRRGHGIGNHSASHPSGWFWALGPRRMAAEIGGAQRTLQEITGVAPRWFRAVVGMANPFVAASLQRLGLARVAWSARGYDAVDADPARVVARIEKDLAPGAIVLLHEGARHGRSVETLEALLERMAALGYRSVLPEAL